jgi:DNA-binding winged helix-turn-helix (wHTH) protein/TolB-like protein
MHIAFEDFVLDADRRELRRGGALVAVQPQVFDLLACIIDQSHRVLSRDDLLERVWGGRIVSESTLATRINAARRALGDSGQEQRLIRTIRGRGIRFVGVLMDGSNLQPGAVGLPAADQDFSGASLAVLRLDNPGTDPALRQFAEDLVEDVVTALSRNIHGIVIHREHAPAQQDTDSIIATLKTKYLMRGSVRLSGEALLMTVQVIERTTTRLVWAERYNRSAASLRLAQEELAALVVNSVLTALADIESEKALDEPRDHMTAESCFHKAMKLLRNHTLDDNIEAEHLLIDALRLNSGLGLLYGGISLAYLERCSAMWSRDVAGDLERVRPAALKSLEFDRGSGLPHSMLSFYEIYHRRHDTALAELVLAEVLNPSIAHTATGASAILAYVGRFDEALRSIETALRQNPRHGPKHFLNRGRILYLLGFYDRAILDLERVLSNSPALSNVRLLLAAALDGAGYIDAAKTRIAEQMEAIPWTTIERVLLVTPFPEPQLTSFVDFLHRYGIPEKDRTDQ